MLLPGWVHWQNWTESGLSEVLEIAVPVEAVPVEAVPVEQLLKKPSAVRRCGSAGFLMAGQIGDQMKDLMSC